MKKTFLILPVLFLSLCVSAQIDTEFWFAAPDLTAGHESQDAISLNIVSYEQPATITISMPANPTFTPITRTLQANDFYTFLLRNHREKVETVANGNVQNSGIQITSTTPVTAYYAATSSNSEIYTLKGRNALGEEFTVPMQYRYKCLEGGYASIEIVASEDNTSVAIVPRVATNVSVANDTIKVKLNKGQAYAVRAADVNTEGINHLQNTKIISDKPIAVSTTDDSATTYEQNAWGDKDLVGEQLVPERLAASKYIAVSNSGAHEYVYISAIYPNTEIFVHDSKGERSLGLVNPGQNFEHKLEIVAGTMFYTKDETPFIAFQLTSDGRELGGSILPNLNCSGSAEVSYKRMLGEEVEITLLTRTENTGSFIVNGSSRVIQAGDFNLVAGDSDWSYAVTKIKNAENINIKNTNGLFHLGVFDAKGGTCSYGYFSNYGNIPLEFTIDKSYYLVGESISFSLYNSAALKDIRWTGPRGVFGQGEVNPTLENITTADAGMYVVEANHKDGCEILPDTFFINVMEKTETKTVMVCIGNSVYLEAEGKGNASGKYEWTPAGLPSTKKILITPENDGLYTVKNYKQGSDRIENGNFTEETSDFYSDYNYGGTSSTALDLPGTYTVGNTPGEYNSKLNNKTEHTGDGGKQFIAHCNAGESVVWQQNISNIQQGTRYVFSAWFAAAKINDTTMRMKIKINDAVSNSFIISNSQEWVYIEYEWTGNDQSATISIVTDANTALGSAVRIDDIHFTPLLEVTDAFQVVLVESLLPQISGNAYLCAGKATIEAEAGYDSYEWNTGEKTQSITVTQAGIYSVKVRLGDCDGSNTFEVAPAERVEFQIGSVPLICSGEPDFSITYTAISGELGRCELLFDEKAQEAGFQNDGFTLSEGMLTIILPENVTPDIYRADLIFIDKKCEERTIFPLEFMVRYPGDILTQRWNDVLGVKNSTFNGGYDFTAYQWYRNGELLSGSTLPYFYEENFFNETDTYNVLLTRTDGSEIFSCDFVPEKLGGGGSIPTVVMPSQRVEIGNVESSGKAIFFSSMGQAESIQTVDNQNTTIQMPARQGLYVLIISIDGKTQSHKVLVK